MVNQPAGWSFLIHNSTRVTFKCVKIKADVRYPNNDGIHINCSRAFAVADELDGECSCGAPMVKKHVEKLILENTLFP